MGYETDNTAFREAAARAQAIHDRHTPADLASAVISDILAGGEPLRTFVPPIFDRPATSSTTENPSIDEAVVEDVERVSFVMSLPDLVAFARRRAEQAAEAAVRAAAAAAAHQQQEEAAEDASDAFIAAQRISLMSVSMDQFADELEIEGLGMVADCLREAAKKARRGARVARSIARDTLDVEVAEA